jgi:Arc/MetJ-type ribon-helix-helix transcriptional regulator
VLELLVKDRDALIESIRESLGRAGVTLETIGSADVSSGDVKVLCLAGNLSDRMEAMAESPRDQVVMVRLNKDVVHQLDSWVETGALRSRSEAAALFIQEGLALRSAELDELRGPLEELRAARVRLKAVAEGVLGGRKGDSDEQ